MILVYKKKFLKDLASIPADFFLDSTFSNSGPIALARSK